MALITVKLNSAETSLIGKYNDNDNVFVECDATEEAFTIDLPDAISALNVEFNIHKADTTVNQITIQSSIAGQTINGEDTQKLYSTGDSAAIRSNGSNYFIV